MLDTHNSVIVGVCLVDFHHKRGPEVEYWHGLPDGTEEDELWSNLPFQALPDGSHSFEETFTYFTLLYDEVNHCSPLIGAAELPEKDLENYTTLFAISCSRQIKTEDLITKDKDVTRSIVQKAIVVISREPIFGQVRDKLSIVTNAYFLQHDFTDKQILVSLYDNLNLLYRPASEESTAVLEGRLYVGLCLRKILHDFKNNVLVILKAFLLEKRIIFYGSNVEYLCNLQFGLISLIPSLLLNLQNSGSPLLFLDVNNLKSVDSFKSSDRTSILQFLGLPLQIFQKGGLFSPYTPLQQLEDIKSEKTKFFVIGSSNSLLYEQREELCDILVDVDDLTIDVIDKKLHSPLQLTGHDKKWIESIVAMVDETWNENDDETPKNSQFKGSEDFIRWQFEDYLTGFLSSVKLFDYVTLHKDNQIALQSIPQDLASPTPWTLFNMHWVNNWKETQNYLIFNNLTDDRLFDLFTPKHAYNGIDNFAIFQQKLISAFQNLRKNSANGSSTSINKNIFNDDSSHLNMGEEKGMQNKSADENVQEEESVMNKGENLWSSWKDYFNKKKMKNSSEAIVNVKGEEGSKKDTSRVGGEKKPNDNIATDRLQQNSTRKAIETALMGLGLHMDKNKREDKNKDNVKEDDEQDRKLIEESESDESGASVDASTDIDDLVIVANENIDDDR